MMKNLLIAIALVLPAANAAAQQNLKLGTLEIHPQVAMQASYDNNIYLVKQAPKGAMISRNAFGVNLLNKVGSRLDLRGGYTLELLGYGANKANNDAAHHLANLGAEWRLPKNMSVSIDDSWMQTTDQATSELTARAKRVQNTAAFGFEAPIRGKFGFNLAAQHTYHNYLVGANSSLDRQEMLVGGDITYKLQPKTRLFVAYRYGTLAYKEAADETNDSTYNNVDFGITGNIAPKITGTAKAGVQYRNYANDLGTADNDTTTAGYSLQFVWKPVEKTDVVIYGKRGNVESSYGTSRYYTSTTGDLTVSRQVRKVKASLGFNYETNDYPELSTGTSKKRLDTNTGFRCNAEYSVQKWLKADLGYTYKHRASNENDFEYSDNIVGLQFKGMF
ncbi:MAG: hypothetical protein A2179_07260 [Elusimicrobia bacterium GWC2_63_65]|nr:MAG: hypothetical protein A2179_07260 [Elusimicrobia bacterium GWC2_63_65]